MTYATTSVKIVGVKQGVVTHTPNVKRKSRECIVGSGGAASAKQEKLGPMLSCCTKWL